MMEPRRLLLLFRCRRRKIYGLRHTAHPQQCQHEKMTESSMSSYSHLNLSGYYLCHSCLCLIPTACQTTKHIHQLTQHNTMASQNRPFPTLIFHAILDERSEGATYLSKMRWCTVDTPDGLAEMIQTIVSAPDSNDGRGDKKTTTLYLAFHQDLLAIHLYPTDKIFIVDLPSLGDTAALDLRAPFNPAQLLHATTATTPEKSTTTAATGSQPDPTKDDIKAIDARNGVQRNSVLEIGALPSLRGLLESPTLPKIVFDSSDTVRALSNTWGVSLRGVRDIQIVELAGRPVPLFHRKANVDRRVGGAGAATKLRTLRACLE